MGVEGILGGHAPAHDGIQKSLPLSGIEAQHLARVEKGSDLRLDGQNCGVGKESQGALNSEGPSQLHLRRSREPGKTLSSSIPERGQE